MLRYNLDQLGWYEFEQLVQTLLKVRVGCGVEAWGGRGDWGRDAYFDGELRYPTIEKENGIFLFQCKFVESANAAGAKTENLVRSAVNKERDRIVERKKRFVWKKWPAVYSFFTNAQLSPEIRARIAEILKTAMPSVKVGLHDGNDICQWLNGSPEVVRSFPQLLSLRDLHELLSEYVHADIRARSETAVSLAEEKSKVFVPTQAYFEAREKLKRHHFVVLEGPPEMGKTTIGRIIALSQMCDDWEAIECRQPSDFLKMYRRDARQVFVADDFFGRTEYHPERVSRWQDDLPVILAKLNATHWLILTSRAHLLEIGKSRLDVSGENARFPKLGEVIVNAGDLTLGEKGRILYRHAKAANLRAVSIARVKQFAHRIVNDEHFTPERIRRLVSEVLPFSEDELLNDKSLIFRIDEALSNPTHEMRVSFRAIPLSHRWLLFSLLECDEIDLEGGRAELQDRYEALCPADEMQPFRNVLDELTEGFVSHVDGGVDWIHPSCRDLAIDELSENYSDRVRFLKNCSSAGIQLASSLAGGAQGERRLPLLRTKTDWQVLEQRVSELAPEEPNLVSILSENLSLIRAMSQALPDLKDAASRLEALIQSTLLPLVRENINSLSYWKDFDQFESYLEACANVGYCPEFSFDTQFAEIEDAVKEWAASSDNFWELADVPGRVSSFLELIEKYQREVLRNEKVWALLSELSLVFRDRARLDCKVAESGIEDDNDYSERAMSCSEYGKSLKLLAQTACSDIVVREELLELSEEMRAAFESLGEQVPQEFEDEDRWEDVGPDENVDLTALFRDL